jgi:signal transduction histidine kinase
VSFYCADKLLKQTTICVVRSQKGEQQRFQEELWDKINPNAQEACQPARIVTGSEEDLQPSQH